MSAILSADDLNDFISPGVACIKPVETLPSAPAASASELEHEVIRDGLPGAGGAPPASISLTDCLACSGCVTSAEAVLVSLQSHKELLRALDAGPALELLPSSTSYVVQGLDDPDHPDRLLYVASVSPQTRANLATACGPGVSAQQAGHMLDHLLSGPTGLRASSHGNGNGNGFAWVVDTNAAREATLVLGADEVAQFHPSPPTSTSSSPPKALLTSSCPGWICYAEKTHPHVLGHLSRVKSPQALTGTLLKTTLSRTLGIPPGRIWHVAIMPCFDKKLEASREELTDAAWDGSKDGHGHHGVRDVDCVITSKEVLMLAESRGIDFFSLPKTPLSPLLQDKCQPSSSRLPFPDAVLDRFLFPPRQRSAPTSAAGSSGGNLHFVLQSVLAQNPGSSLQTNRGRNVDVVEYAITAPGLDEPLFKAARYYGFRNIQNLVRRLRPARPSRLPGGRPVGSAARRVPTGKAGAGLDFAYVEVMACPGGCTNGGGQIKADDDIVVARKGLTTKPGPQEQRAWLAQIDEAYLSADDDDTHSSAADGRLADEIDGISPSYVRETLAHWARITGIDLQRLAYTTYREVLSDVGKPAKGADTVERVAQLAGKIGGGW
ncbi:iron-sulfur cluster assembly associated protein [Grosmannia clavigera kw1407]|uniref:Nuclear architecture-related protein 1 n=1 Tax=Grosmannia clavigera (strain kw1407 / UAMH 11150) TaxID=655863 RepID=F0XFU6_GROCL|nr:iron-sulfur cluster assembly associated protein [Grosmannia clavigera kw1407]EFX03601.1 iron-sulfur cluster assembly associated protein [Grosmannia clavigera kw1407]